MFRDVTRSLSLAFHAFWPPKCSSNLQSLGHEGVQGTRRVLRGLPRRYNGVQPIVGSSHESLAQGVRQSEIGQSKANIRKCEFANAKLDFLGHTLSLNIVQPRQRKVEALLKFPAPNNKKQVQSLLGLAGYYRKFLPHFADLTLPLTALLKKNVPFKWSEAANAAFVDLKSRLASRPILRPPNYDLPFSVAVDA